MGKWLLTVNNEEYIFDSFEEVTQAFLLTIRHHIWEYSYNNKESKGLEVFGNWGTPLSIMSFFGYKYDELKITDEEILIQTRLDMLMRCFYCKSKELMKEQALKVIGHSYDYYSEEEDISTRASIKIDYSSEEISVDIVDSDWCGSHEDLRTNAFIIEDENKTYYFNSFQIVQTSSDSNNLGKEIRLDISLSKIGD